MATKINSATQLAITAALLPDTADGAALGTASKEWSDLYLADGSIIYMGNDQDVQLLHVADTGVRLNSTRQLQFGDAASNIKQVSDSNLEIESDGTVIIDSPVLDLQDDGVIVKFGDDSDVTLTHVADTALLLNSTRQLQFGDSATHIKQVSDSNLEIEADGSIILDAPVVLFDDDGATLKFGADDEITLSHVHNVGLLLSGSNAGVEAHALRLGDSGESVVGDGTDLTLNSGGDIKLTATANVEASLSGTKKLTFDGATAATFINRENAGTGGEILTMKALKGLRLQTAGTANQIDVKLGSTDANSSFKVLSSADGAAFQADADGDVTVGKDLVVAGTSIDVDGASALTIGATVGANNLTLGASTSTVIIPGGLTVQGTTTTVDSTTINISSSFTFEGPADDHETTFGIVDPTADATINLPAMSAGTYFVPVLAAASTTAVSSTPEELNLVDGTSAGTIVNSKAVIYGSSGEVNATTLQIAGTSITATAAELNIMDGDAADSSGGFSFAANTDRFVINDGGVMKQITFATVGDAIGGGSGIQSSNGVHSIDVERETFGSGSARAEFQMVTIGSGAKAGGMTASLNATPISSDALAVYVNGMLLSPSGSAAKPITGFDYRFYSSTNASNEPMPSGFSRDKVYLEEALDSDDILTVQYIKN